MTTGVQISSVNFDGQIANITFYPDTGGTISLGANVLPYTTQLEYYYGSYELYFGAFDETCFAYINNPITPTPTPTETETPTPTVTNTPTTTETPSQTPTNTQTSTNTPTPSTTPSVVTSGLIIELDAYSSTSYPGSGTDVFNLRNIGTYTHTLSNAPYTELNTIKCFDCSTSPLGVIEVPLGTGPTLPTSGYTYISWARIKSSSAEYRTLFRTSSDHPILVEVGNNNLGFWDNAQALGFEDSGYDVTPIVDVWAQYAVVGDSSSSDFYINGNFVGSVPYGAGGNSHYEWGGHGGQSFGYVANMYYYNRKLSLSEITQQYNFLAPRFVEPTPTATPTPTVTQTPTMTNTPTPTSGQTLTITTFTSVGTTSWTAPSNVTSVEYLVVAGGGGGGNGYDSGGGGGAGGGMVLSGITTVTPGDNYTVTVGSGGTGGADTRTNNPGTDGGNSVFDTTISLGGQGGYGSRTAPGGAGVGGAAQNSNVTSGRAGNGGGGGNAGGGGGGATGAGTNRISASSAGVGGAGLTSTITGSSVVYGGGGNGGTANAGTINGSNGASNTGKGGGAGSSNSADSASGGNGGSGIVILKYYV